MNKYLLRVYKSKDELLSISIINEISGNNIFEFKDDLSAIRHLIRKSMQMKPYQEYVIYKYIENSLIKGEKMIANWTNPNEN